MPDTHVLPSGPLLLVSPHLDDAALSCGALLERPEPLVVLDVFTERPEPEQHTAWDSHCGFAGSHDAMAARLLEERAAYAGSPHTFVTADLFDAQYLAAPRGDDDSRRLARTVDAWLAEHPGASVAVPVGAGTPAGVKPSFGARWQARRAGTFLFDNSPDHLFVRDTIVGHLRDRDVPLWLYEEFPYLFALGGARVVGAVAEWAGRAVIAHDVPVDRAAKARRVAAYTSQLPMLFRDGDVAAIARTLPAVERYWELPAS